MRKVTCDVFDCNEQADTGVYYKKSGNIVVKYCSKHKKEMRLFDNYTPKRYIYLTRQFGREGLNWRNAQKSTTTSKKKSGHNYRKKKDESVMTGS